MGYENINQFHNNNNSIDKTFTNNDKIKAIKYWNTLENILKKGFLWNMNVMLPYLTSKYEQMKVGRHLPYKHAASAGVPQGSNLGSLLFAFFINPLPSSKVFR